MVMNKIVWRGRGGVQKSFSRKLPINQPSIQSFRVSNFSELCLPEFQKIWHTNQNMKYVDKCVYGDLLRSVKCEHCSLNIIILYYETIYCGRRYFSASIRYIHRREFAASSRISCNYYSYLRHGDISCFVTQKYIYWN